MRGLAIKICGVTREADAIAAADFGATHIGIIFAERSARKVGLEQAKRISQVIANKAGSKVVGVFQNQTKEFIEHIHREVKLDAIQYHGSERPCEFSNLAPAIKAITNDASLEQLESIERSSTMLLFDRPKEAGEWSNDWPNALHAYLANHNIHQPFLIAGGIEANNALEFIRNFRRYKTFAGIDVASGVESEPGIKDHKKLQALFFAIEEETRHANNR